MTTEADRRRPRRALDVLKELMRAYSFAIESPSFMTKEQSDAWHDARREARELLALEVPGTEVKP